MRKEFVLIFLKFKKELKKKCFIKDYTICGGSPHSYSLKLIIYDQFSLEGT